MLDEVGRAAAAVTDTAQAIQKIISEASIDVQPIQANVLRITGVLADALEAGQQRPFNETAQLAQERLFDLMVDAKLFLREVSVHLDSAAVHASRLRSVLCWTLPTFVEVFGVLVAFVVWHLVKWTRRHEDTIYVQVNFGSNMVEMAETCVNMIKHKAKWAREGGRAPEDAHVLIVPVGLNPGISSRIWRERSQDVELDAMLLSGSQFVGDTLTTALKAAENHHQSSSKKAWFLFLLFSFRDTDAHGPHLHEVLDVPEGVSISGFNIVSTGSARAHSISNASTMREDGNLVQLNSRLTLWEDAGVGWYGSQKAVKGTFDQSGDMSEKKDA